MSTELKRLYRSQEDRMVAGVCAGLGEYFNTDPTLVRLLAVAGFFINPPCAFLAYFVMMLVVPEQPVNSTSTT